MVAKCLHVCYSVLLDSFCSALYLFREVILYFQISISRMQLQCYGRHVCAQPLDKFFDKFSLALMQFFY